MRRGIASTPQLIAFAYLAAAIIIRLLAPPDGEIKTALLYGLPAAAVFALIVVGLLQRNTPIRVPLASGARGSEPAPDFLRRIQEMLREVLREELPGQLRPLQDKFAQSQADITRMTLLIDRLKRNNTRDQAWGIAVGIIGGWLLSGVPIPFLQH
jgi:hypothetical protein